MRPNFEAAILSDAGPEAVTWGSTEAFLINELEGLAHLSGESKSLKHEKAMRKMREGFKG